MYMSMYDISLASQIIYAMKDYQYLELNNI